MTKLENVDPLLTSRDDEDVFFLGGHRKRPVCFACVKVECISFLSRPPFTMCTAGHVMQLWTQKGSPDRIT